MNFVNSIKKHRASIKFNQLGLNFEAVQSLFDEHTNSLVALDNIKRVIQARATANSTDLSKLLNLSVLAETLRNTSLKNQETSDALSLLEVIFDLATSYTLLRDSYLLLGLSKTSGISSNYSYTSFTIPKDWTLSKVSALFYNDTEKVSEIFKANSGLINLKQEEYALKTIKVPVTPNMKLSSSLVGEEAWGADLSNSLEASSDGDLQVLSFRDSLIQGVINTVSYSLGSIPEDLNVGNAFISEVGGSFTSINELVASNLLRHSLLLDPAIEKASVSNFKFEQDSISADVFVKPIFSEDVISISL